MSDKCVLVIGDGMTYYEPFKEFGRFTRDQSYLAKPDKVALVVLTGGADISPSLYGAKPSRMTSCVPRRDIYEMLAFRKAKKNKLPIVGICRGAQFLCAMVGGKLIQHVEGHGGYHKMRTWDDRVIEVNSTHHQMQMPPKDAVPLGWADPPVSRIYIGEDDETIAAPDKEYECVFYPSINAVGIQYHPESMGTNSEGRKLASELIHRFLMKD